MAYTTINKSSLHMNTKLYTGTGSSNALTGINFQPDLTWIKVRSNSTYTHALFDSVRGVNKPLQSSSTSAEVNDASGGNTSLNSFDSDGFTLGGFYNKVNQSGQTFASWNWKAGTTSGITTDGNTTITPSSYSINQTAGFSILSYTGNGVEGAKLAHGLGTTPAMVIIKRYSTTGDWVVYHKNLSATKSLFLNYTDAETARAPNGYIYSPDATNITLSNHGDINTNGTTTIAYCFAEKTGYSKIGSYVGNGSTDGTFIYTGFKPAWVMYKASSISAQSWLIHDNKRGNQGANANPQDLRLLANATNSEADVDIDFLSNGFKPRASGTHINSSGTTYIYMAFGQSLVGDNNVPCTAR